MNVLMKGTTRDVIINFLDRWKEISIEKLIKLMIIYPVVYD